VCHIGLAGGAQLETHMQAKLGPRDVAHRTEGLAAGAESDDVSGCKANGVDRRP
jgi:hypothetical protein